MTLSGKYQHLSSYLRITSYYGPNEKLPFMFLQWEGIPDPTSIYLQGASLKISELKISCTWVFRVPKAEVTMRGTQIIFQITGWWDIIGKKNNPLSFDWNRKGNYVANMCSNCHPGKPVHWATLRSGPARSSSSCTHALLTCGLTP